MVFYLVANLFPLIHILANFRASFSIDPPNGTALPLVGKIPGEYGTPCLTLIGYKSGGRVVDEGSRPAETDFDHVGNFGPGGKRPPPRGEV